MAADYYGGTKETSITTMDFTQERVLSLRLVVREKRAVSSFGVLGSDLQ